MGRSEPLDSEEIKFICTQIMVGRTDTQIKSALEENWGKRDIRTIRLIRRVFEAAQEVILERLVKTGKIAEGQLSEDVSRAIEVVNHMVRGQRPYFNDKTGKIEYEAWLEI